MVSRIVNRLLGRDDDPDCEEVRGLSSDYIDGDLDGPVAAKVDSHLAWCGPCSAFINTLKATVALLRSSTSKDAPSGFTEQVRENLPRSPRD